MLRESWIIRLTEQGYIPAESLNVTDKGIPREIKRRVPHKEKPLTLEQIIEIKGDLPYFKAYGKLREES